MKTDNSLKPFGLRIRQARKAANLTQNELADACGYPGGGAVISKIEAGGMWPPLPMIESMAKTLKTTPAFLAFGDEPGEEVAELRELVKSQQETIRMLTEALHAP